MEREEKREDSDRADMEAFVKAYVDQLNVSLRSIKDIGDSLGRYLNMLEGRRDAEQAKITSLNHDLAILESEKAKKLIPAWAYDLVIVFIGFSIFMSVLYFVVGQFSILESAAVVVGVTIFQFGFSKSRRDEQARAPSDIKYKISERRLILEKIEGQIEATKFALKMIKP